MPLLHHFRTNRSRFARHTFAMFASVWMMIALQPCAMAFDMSPDTEVSAPMKSMSNMDHPCDHCPEEPNTNECQFEDWGSPNQAMNLAQDAKPLTSFDQVVILLPLAIIKPSKLHQELHDQTLSKIQYPTPTLKHDILRC